MRHRTEATLDYHAYSWQARLRGDARTTQKAGAAAGNKKPQVASKAATRKAKAKEAGGKKKPKRVSALDAAAQVLAKAGKPMRVRELIATMADQNLWKSSVGATTHATLYAAMMQEARDKGSASRFRKVDRGMFEFAGK